MHVTPKQETRYLANLNEGKKFLETGAQQTVKLILGRQTLKFFENKIFFSADEGAENTLK